MNNIPKLNMILLSIILATTIIGFSVSYFQINTLQKQTKAINKDISDIKKEQLKYLEDLTKLNNPSRNQPKREILSTKQYIIDDLNSISIGPKNAAVTLAIWTDFQCPYCAKSSKIVSQLQEKYKTNIRFSIKNYPLPMHKQAKKTAKYALAANKQNAYLPMYLKIFDRFKELKANPDLPVTLARELKLNTTQLLMDFNNPEIEKQIEKEIQQLNTLGVRQSVPKYFINGREYNGRRTLKDFSYYIDQALQAKK